MEVRVAGIQMLVSPDVDVNLPKVLSNLAAAAEEGAEFVHFPEMSLSGYHGKYDFEKVKSAVKEVVAAAKKHRVAVLIGTGTSILLPSGANAPKAESGGSSPNAAGGPAWSDRGPDAEMATDIQWRSSLR